MVFWRPQMLQHVARRLAQRHGEVPHKHSVISSDSSVIPTAASIICMSAKETE